MNFVVLTNNGSIFGRQVVAAMRRAGIVPAAVVIDQPPSYKFRLLKRVARKNGWTDAILQAFHVLRRERTRRRELRRTDPTLFAAYHRLVPQVRFVPGTNHAATLRAVAALDCDILVLAQCGIVRAELLAVPRIGTLNAHPGVLPLYRGIDSCRWAILREDWQNIGVSVHWVDRGVDTGPVLSVSRRDSPLEFRTADALEDSLFSECADRLAEVAGVLALGKAIPAVPQDANAGAQFYKMKRNLIAQVDEALRVQASLAPVRDS